MCSGYPASFCNVFSTRRIVRQIPIWCHLVNSDVRIQPILASKYNQTYKESTVLTGFYSLYTSPILASILIPEEELMTIHKVRRLIRLHEKATRHLDEYKRLAGDLGAQSKALKHQEKAERLHSQVRALIRDFTPDAA